MTKSAKPAALLLAGACLALHASAQLNPSEERGRAIYFGETGSALDRATAEIGTMGVALPAASFPCSSCHGERGQGQAERGVAPSDLSQDALTRPYSVQAAAGRVRPPYDRDLFERALTSGFDSGGTDLSEAMPRFNLSPDEISDLWSFLAKLKQPHDPGLTDTEIRIAIALPLSGPNGRTGVSMFGVAEALISGVNEAGGVHGRSIVLQPYDEAAGEAVPQDVFLVLGAHEPVDGVPTISSNFEMPPGPTGFSLTSGQAEQEAALRLHAVETWGVVRVDTVSCDEARTGTLLLTDPACNAMTSKADRLLVPGNVFSRISPEGRNLWPSKTFVALPLAVDKISQGAQASFARTRMKSRFESVSPVAEAEIYSAGVLAIEGLMRSGRGVTRKVLQEKLENIQGFVGAMVPPVTYSANDHVGSNGAHIVAFDAATGRLASKGAWIDPAAEGR